MKKKIAAAATALVAALLVSSCAQPQTTTTGASEFPTKPMNMVISFAAGGSTDVGARLIAKGLEDKLGQPVVAENKAGASGQVGNSALVSAKADGYTVGTVSLAGTLLSYLDPDRGASYKGDSFKPVALYVQDPQVFVVSPNSPYKSLEELVAAAKADPGKLRVATSGIATQDHVAKVLFEEMSGTKFAPVHFSDGAAPATTAFLGNNVEILITNVGDVKDMVANNQARVLGVASAERNDFLPDAPTFKEQGYDFELASSRGFVVPGGTPDDVVAKISDAIGDVMDDEETIKQLRDMNLTPDFLGHAEFKKLWDETESSFSGVLERVKADL
ncbi:tripartite tricarboxylate transporter substrate binding protein [Pseudarthrobacter sp. NamE5]|uniref:tripartite tricarboxylate transporter substrate binding protein n=1 Tax=Pseudarthrobacter sp. NamE5 TaxID=2576839 RepID=UPI00110BBDEE|nr:tripartite tricarboxylate transporter substrate binding protein [Pseudarthrobacter sp. NamE5]TLM88272.1 tripartite tricarboxylate transporter substrate binding protein [Pseudarthrobacter sp. NamE5]